MDFSVYGDLIHHPFAGKTADGGWLDGTISADWLNDHSGQYETLDECIQATDSEGLKLFFEYLKTQQ